MLFLLRFILYSVAIPSLLLMVCFSLAIENTPSQSFPDWKFSRQDINKAKRILHANQNAAGSPIKLSLTERDLNLACTYLLNLYLDAHTHIQLTPQYILFKLRFNLPKNVFGRLLIMQFELHLSDYQALKLKNLHIGKLSIRDEYAGFLVNHLIKYTQLDQYLAIIRENLKNIKLHQHKLHINYQLPHTGLQSIQRILAPKIDQRALAQYKQRLKKILKQHDPKWLLSLSELLQGLFQLAQQRSTKINAIAENKLVILIANQYVNQNKTQILQQGLPYYAIYMYKRMDLVQHFMLSAMLASSGGGQAAQIIGLEKELDDAQQGSGFSFMDLAADKAGIYFGEFATANPEKALRLQQKMANIKHYRAFMPTVKDLPEHLSVQVFKAKYESIYSPAFQNILKKIDQRIIKSTIYH